MAKISGVDLRRAISEIMRGADLTTMSAKKIRFLCEKKFKVDLTSRKKEIDQIVMSLLENEGSSDEEDNKSEGGSSEGCSSGGSSDGGSSSDGENADSESEASSASRCSSHPESCSDSESSSSSEDSSPKKKKTPTKVERKTTLSSTKDKVDKEKKMDSASQAAKGEKLESKLQKKNSTPKQSVKGNKSSQEHKNSVDSLKMPKKNKPAASSKIQKRPISSPKVDSDSDLSSQEIDDAAIARKLQAEEWNFRHRAAKRLPREVSKKKVAKDAQSKPRKTSTYSRKCALSADLAEVMNTTEMARHDVVKKMWSIVRERNLFDPANKQFAFCDEQLLKVFGKRRIRLFGMMKYLKNHIKDID